MFRRRETAGSDAAPISPRAMIRPPQSFDNESDQAQTIPPPPPSASEEPPSSPTRKPKDLSLSPKKEKKREAAAKAIIKPSLSIETDTAQTQQEYVMGKGVIRPLLSPVEPPKADVFSRFSFRRKSGPIPASKEEELSPVQPPQPENAEEPHSAPVRAALDDEAQADVVMRIAERRGWGKTLPTANPHCLHALLKESNPFKKVRNLSAATAQELTTAVENSIYCTPRAVNQASRFRFQRGDVVVVGCPRSGQTPILRILDALREKTMRPTTSLVDDTIWVEGPYGVSGRSSAPRRILKTYMSCENVMRGSGRILEHKIIVVLRDPADVRLSWFRHVRRLAKKCAHQSIDQNTGASAFADIALPMPCLNKSLETDVSGMEPEYMIASALKAQNESPDNVLIIFYEQLFTDPAKVVESIAQFTHFMEPEAPPKRVATSSVDGDGEDRKLEESKKRQELELIYSIANMIVLDPCHPNLGKRNGSSGQGVVCFLRPALEQMDAYWERQVQNSKDPVMKITSYQHLYQLSTKERYHFAEDRQNGGSGGLFTRLSNLRSSNASSLGVDGTHNSRLRKKDSSLDSSSIATSTTSSTRLKKQGSSADSEKIVKPRKFGGSFLKLLTRGSSFNSNSGSSLSVATKEHPMPAPEKPLIINFPQVYFCVDPDDSDDEMSKAPVDFKE